MGRIERARQAPTQADCVAEKGILRYVAGSACLVIRYRRGVAVEPVASVDSSFADGDGLNIFLAGPYYVATLVMLSTAGAEYVKSER